MGLLSEQSDTTTGTGFAGGVEFEETFPEPFVEPVMTKVAAPTPAPVKNEPPLEEQLDRRLREAEAMLKETINEMLFEWQTRFERRLEERRANEERQAEKRRVDDEQRLRVWRSELEQALNARFAERHAAERALVPDRNGEARSAHRDALASASSARDVGRLVRDLVTEITHTTSFALAVHHDGRDEVAYRYRVASEGELGVFLRKEALEDGPDSAAAHGDGWTRAQRTLRLAGQNVTVHTAQLAVKTDAGTVGVLTLQSEGDAIADSLLARVAELARLAAPRLVALRASGNLRGA
jgi:hypothetical protein